MCQYRWVEGDALDLPFPDGYFDAITVGYGLRNVVDKHRAMLEMLRVLKPGLMSIISLCVEIWKPVNLKVRPDINYSCGLFRFKSICPWFQQKHSTIHCCNSGSHCEIPIFFFFSFKENHVLNSGNCCFSLHILSTKMFSKQEITMDALPVLFSVAASDYEQFVVFIHMSYVSVSVWQCCDYWILCFNIYVYLLQK